MEQMRKNPYKRVDSENMTELDKMDQGFNGKTYTVNGIEVDFWSHSLDYVDGGCANNSSNDAVCGAYARYNRFISKMLWLIF